MLMSNAVGSPLLSIEELNEACPIPSSVIKQIQVDRDEVKAILSGADSRCLVILGHAQLFQALQL